MSKYNNADIFPVIKTYNKNVYEFLKSFNTAICLSDDILDHQIHTDYTVDVLSSMFDALKWASKCSGLTEKIYPLVMEIAESEKLNLDFVPLKNDNETEIKVLFKRASLMKLYFECLCYVDKSFDTKDNRLWAEKFAEAGLIFNDCKGLIDGGFEDLIQCRRNYAILKSFNQDIYFNWRELKDEIIEAAKLILNDNILERPKDERLTMIGGSNA